MSLEPVGTLSIVSAALSLLSLLVSSLHCACARRRDGSTLWDIEFAHDPLKAAHAAHPEAPAPQPHDEARGSSVPRGADAK